MQSETNSIDPAPTMATPTMATPTMAAPTMAVPTAEADRAEPSINEPSLHLSPPAQSASAKSESQSRPGSPKSVHAPSTTRSQTPVSEEQLLLKLCHPYFKDSAPHMVDVCDLLYKLDGMFYMPVENAELDTSLVNELLVAVNHIVQTVSRATGGVMYVCYMRDDGQQGTEIWDERVQSLLVNQRGDLLRRIIGDYVHSSLGPTFTCRSESAFPASFGSPADSCRPRLPPPHPLVDQERIVISRYFAQLAAWQGLPQLRWSDVEHDVASLSYRLVEKSRIPPVLLRFCDPVKMAEQEIHSLGRYLRSCQDALDNSDPNATQTAFQWREPGSTAFRTEIHPDSSLTYTEAETFYMMSMRRHSFSTDHYTGPAESDKVFSPKARKLMQEYGKDVPMLDELVDMIERQRHTGAPERTARDTDPKLLERQTAVPHNVVDSLSDDTLPSDFTDPSSDVHEFWLVSALWRHVHKGNVVDPASQRPWGGFGGVLRYFLASFRAYRVIKSHIDGTAKLLPSHSRFGQQELDRIISIFQELHRVMKADVIPPRDARPGRIPLGTAHTPWPARRVGYTNILGDNVELEWSHPFTAMRLESSGGPEQMKQALAAGMKSGQLLAHDIDAPMPEGQATGPEDSQLVQNTVLPNPYTKAATTAAKPGAQQRAAELRKSSTTKARPKPLPPLNEEESRRRSHSLPPSENDVPGNALELTMDDPASPRGELGMFAFGDMPGASTPHLRGRSLVKDKEREVVDASSKQQIQQMSSVQPIPADSSTSQSRLGEAARLLARNSQQARSTAPPMSPVLMAPPFVPRASSVIQQRTGPARKQVAKRTRGDGDTEAKESAEAQRKKSRSGSRK